MSSKLCSQGCSNQSCVHKDAVDACYWGGGNIVFSQTMCCQVSWRKSCFLLEFVGFPWTLHSLVSVSPFAWLLEQLNVDFS